MALLILAALGMVSILKMQNDGIFLELLSTVRNDVESMKTKPPSKKGKIHQS